MEIEVDKLEGMTQEELEAMEDKAIADDASDVTDKTVVPPKKEDDPKPDTTEVADDSNDKGVKSDEVSEPEVDENLQEHISPPEKWIQKRIANREAKQPQDDTGKTSEELNKVNAELLELKQQIEWLKDSGVDVGKTPIDMLSDDKIADVRKEFGDELADMFQAVKSMQPKNVAEQQAPEKPKVETPAVTEEPVNVEMETAIDNNNDLAYWRETSPSLWDKAVEKNADLLESNPDYQKLSFDDRFKQVVESVKTDVVNEAKEKAPEAKDSQSVPDSLSGSGASHTKTNETILDRLDNATPEEAEKIYRGLSEAERDKVDIELGI